PDVDGDVLAGRVLEARNVVQVVVIEAGVQHRPRLVDDAEIDEPAGLGVHRTGDGDLHLVAVPVHPRALVPRRDARQTMRRLEAVLLGQLHIHGWSIATIA